MPPKRKGDLLPTPVKMPRAGVDKATFALFLNDEIMDSLAPKLAALGAKVLRGTAKECQGADFLVVDVAHVQAKADDFVELYYLQPEWWRAYKPGLVTDLMAGATHETARRAHHIPVKVMDTLLLPAFQKLLTMPFPQLEVRRRSRHYYGARVYAQDEVPLATRLVGWPSLPSEIATRIFQYLPYKSLGCAAQVAKSWRALSFSPVLWEDRCRRSPIWPYYFCDQKNPYATKNKPICQFGTACYRKNPHHIAQFYHPQHDQNPDPNAPLPPRLDLTKFSHEKAAELLIKAKSASPTCKNMSWYSYFRIYVLPLEIDLERTAKLEAKGLRVTHLGPAMMMALQKKGLRSFKPGATLMGGGTDIPNPPAGSQCILQINFEEMSVNPTVSFLWHNQSWPSKGILGMFSDEDMCEGQVRYWDGAYTRTANEKGPDEWLLNACAIHFFEAFQVFDGMALLLPCSLQNDRNANDMDGPVDTVKLSEAEWEPLPGLNHMMLGKPDPVQDDPCGPDDVLLLQADTDEAQLGVMWGDVGRFYFTAKAKELEGAIANPAMLNSVITGEMQCS